MACCVKLLRSLQWPGLAVETLLITPLAIAILAYESSQGTGHWSQSWSLTLLFIGCGVITSMPLLWFNNAAKRLKLATLGFLSVYGSQHSAMSGCISLPRAVYFNAPDHVWPDLDGAVVV